jgi:hypothetical protein
MKRKALYGLTAAALMSVITAGSARAQAAYTASFSTSITYQNVGANAATIVIVYYNTDGSQVTFPAGTLNAGASSSVFAGNVTNLAAGFQGAAILSSNEPVVATLVQVGQGAGAPKNRPLSNGFSAGSSKVLIATALKDAFGVSTKFSVQNASAGASDFVVKFFSTTSSTPVHTVNLNGVPAGAARYVDVGATAALPAGFSGSATVESFVAGSTTNTSEIVASALELGTSGPYSAAFEGVAAGSGKVYMPSALCNAFGGYNSAYAVQNTGTAAATVNVQYANGATQSATIQPGAKASFQTCAATGMPQGYSGSAVIDAGSGTIVAIGKVSGLGVTTAFVGANTGAAKLACPYVRWSDTQYPGARQRVFLAIQNIGSAAAGPVTVKYIDKNGAQVGNTITFATIAAAGKANSNAKEAGAAAAEFGAYPDGTFGGGAIIEGPTGAQLVAIARVQTADSATVGVGEDYNCQAVQ